MMSGEIVEKLGERLSNEARVENLNEVFKLIRKMQFEKNESANNQHPLYNPILGLFGLDTMCPTYTSPVIELISPASAYHPAEAGKTSLLYLIISHAILPAYLFSSIPLCGQNAAVVVFDPLNHFSVTRLAEVMANILQSKAQAAGRKVDEKAMSEMRALCERCILHVHICRPKSWPSFLAMLRSLHGYLFHKEKHESLERRVHSIILDDVDAFVWSIRNTTNPNTKNANSLATASNQLTVSLQKLSTSLSCAVILTSSSASPTAIRPPFPSSWSQSVQVTRYAVHRVSVTKFAPAISAEQAEGERQQRWIVANQGRFECWNAGMGVKDGSGFVFRVGEWGVEVESGVHEELRLT